MVSGNDLVDSKNGPLQKDIGSCLYDGTGDTTKQVKKDDILGISVSWISIPSHTNIKDRVVAQNVRKNIDRGYLFVR